MPTFGPYLPLMSRLTEKGVDSIVMPRSQAPLYIFTASRRFVVDLSKSGARTADLDLTLNWNGPADYDLGVTLPWGFAGSHQPVSGGAPGLPGEHLVLKNVPTCADIMVAAENFVSLQVPAAFPDEMAFEATQATLTIAVDPKKGR
jgi:hypothetical protein